MVVQGGIRLPLEVFYTGADRGWGVRCSKRVGVGAFIAEYAGAIITNREAVRDLPRRRSLQSSCLPARNAIVRKI